MMDPNERYAFLYQVQVVSDDFYTGVSPTKPKK
jgi:hypothetical protein